MVGYTLSEVLSEHGSVSRGIGEVDKNSYLTKVQERKTIVIENKKIIAKEKDGDIKLSPNAPTAMNFFGFQPSIFSFISELFMHFLKENHHNITSEFYIPLVANELIKQNKGKMKVIGGGDIWFGVTYKEDKEIVSESIRKLIAKGQYPAKLWP